MKTARVQTAMVAMLCGLGMARNPLRAVAQCCGDCNGDGEISITELVKAVNRALDGCSDDGICSEPTGQRFPATGQTTAYGSGSDGDVKAGAALSYTDNGDGTITDNNSGLMWEKKDDSGGFHDKDNTYTWGMESPPYTMNGTMVTEFLATLNTSPCFANHCDWRIPNIRELQSIVDYEIPYPGPTVNAAFHNAAGCTGCTDLTLPSCSCTGSNVYWASTTYAGSAGLAWLVFITGGSVFPGSKAYDFYVRAVRGGL